MRPAAFARWNVSITATAMLVIIILWLIGR